MLVTIGLAVFAAILGSGGAGALVAFFYLRETKRKLGAEARLTGLTGDDIVSGRALEMYDRMEQRVDKAEEKLDDCRFRMAALEDHVDVLEQMIRRAELVPPPFRYPPPPRMIEGGT